MDSIRKKKNLNPTEILLLNCLGQFGSKSRLTEENMIWEKQKIKMSSVQITSDFMDTSACSEQSSQTNNLMAI